MTDGRESEIIDQRPRVCRFRGGGARGRKGRAAMAKKNSRNTKGRIIQAAWQLFYQQGYDDTTVEEIIEASGTSRGFYHYFEGKDALLSSVSFLFDEKYEELMARMDPEKDRFEVLMELNRELFAMIENSISLDLLARLYSSQLVTRGQASAGPQPHILQAAAADRPSGAAAGELRGDVTVNEMVRVYALCERALIYDWCLSGDYSLLQYGRIMMPMFWEDFGQAKRILYKISKG